MRELESSLQEFGEFLLKAQLARPAAAPYFVRWVRRFLSRPASDEPLTDQVRGFCEELERNGATEDSQVRQADQALRIYFVNFLKRTDWHQRPASTVVDEQGQTSPLTALAQLRQRIRNPPLLLSHGMHLRGLGSAVSRICLPAAGGSPSSRRIGGGARLLDAFGGAPAGLGQYAERGVLRAANFASRISTSTRGWSSCAAVWKSSGTIVTPPPRFNRRSAFLAFAAKPSRQSRK